MINNRVDFLRCYNRGYQDKMQCKWKNKWRIYWVKRRTSQLICLKLFIE